MREIKFRAWDKEYNFMIMPDDIVPSNYEIITGDGKVMEFEESHSYTGTNTEWEDASDKRILMQYTGLKDKNGKEIYEGDIVRVLYTGGGKSTSISDVRFEKGCFTFTENHALQNHALQSILGKVTNHDNYEIEVIGNIYENPELMEESK